MERIRISKIEAGQVFSDALFSASGQKLLPAFVTVTEKHLELIRRSGEFEVLVAKDVDELVESGIVARADSTNLRVGQKSQQGLIARTGQVVVEPGDEIEAHHLDALAAGNGAFVSRSKAQQRRDRLLLGDVLVEELERQSSSLILRITPEAESTWLQPTDPGEWPTPASLTERRNAAVEVLRGLYARIEAGVVVNMGSFNPLVDALLDRQSKFATRFTQLALLCPRREDYLPDHAYTVTVLAMAIAAQLRWPRDAVREVGQAGLLFDLGMLLVPERIRTGACELTDIDRSRVQRHPVFTLAMLQVVQDVPPIIKLAALQHHERENGSGYPRGARRDATCDYARVLAVADTFAATTEPRHYRKPKLPYIAMEETIRSTTAHAFWKPAVRALLESAGLFPVGSFVKLSNSKNAHVIASNPKQLDRPTIQPLGDDGQPKGSSIDLATVPKAELSVVRPIAGMMG